MSIRMPVRVESTLRAMRSPDPAPPRHLLDRSEREADRVAEHVLHMRVPLGQPRPLHAATAGSGEGRRATEGRLTGIDASAEHIVTGAHADDGQPLDAPTRAFMERRFGHDFARVRIHTDRRSADAARGLAARAFTVGDDVFFARGQYSPQTSSGRALLAHELAHVVQQRPPGMLAIQTSPWDVRRPTASASPEPPGSAPGRPTPIVIEIGERAPISSEDPALVHFATTVLDSPTVASSIHITGFWNVNTVRERGGVDRPTALRRAHLVRSALAELGVPLESMEATSMDASLLSNATSSPAGMVRIAFYPAGLRPLALPPPVQVAPPPRIPGLVPSPWTPAQQAPRAAPPATRRGQPKKDEKTRAGKPSDLLKAALAIPEVAKAIEEAKREALEDFERLSPAAKGALISGAIAIGAGAALGAGLGGHATSVLETLDGAEIPIPLPRVPGKFSVQILGKEKAPEFDPHAPAVPDKPGKPAGRGLVLKWEIEF
jgi:hypothetical protein